MNPFDTSEFESRAGLDDDPEGGGLDPLDELAQEYADRWRRGESPSISEYEARFPEEAGRVRNLLSAVAMMERLRQGTRPARAAPERLGEFRIVRELGRGGMGVVYEAVQESLGRHVAVKAMHHVHLDPKRLLRFRREAEAVARLHHTNIVPIFAVGEHEGLPYYAMQQIRGGGLDALLGEWRRQGGPPGEGRWRLAARLGMQAAGALQYAHEQGVLHRDIKPANILVDEHQSAWITDFGLAKLAGRGELTASGDVVGTLRYLAPEALRGEADARGDVYSLGLTLYELLTLSPPFGELDPSELLRQVGEGSPAPPRRVDPSIPADLETIVLRATAREPGHRYPTSGAMADDLRRFLEDRPILARRATAAEGLWRWCRRNRATAALAATAAGMLLLAAAVGWIGYASTARALEGESRRRDEAERATGRAEKNVALSLEVFEDLFEKLAPRDDVLHGPPLGQAERTPPRGPRGEGGPPPGGPRAMPPRAMGPGDGPRGPGPDRGPRLGEPPGRASEEDALLLRSVLTFFDRFARQNSLNPPLQEEAARAYRKVGALYQRLGKEAEAEAAISRSIAMFEELARSNPGDAPLRLKLAEACAMENPWSAPASSLGRIEGRLRRARGLLEGLARDSPEGLASLRARVQVEAKLGATLRGLERPDEAEACYLKAVELSDTIVGHATRPAGAKLDRAAALEGLAMLRLARGRRNEALADLAAIDADLRSRGDSKGLAGPILSQARRLAELYAEAGEEGRAQEVARWADEIRSRPPSGNDGPREGARMRPPRD